MPERHQSGLLVKFGLRLSRIGQGRAGGNGIDANMLRRQRLRKGFGQCRQAGFRDSVAGEIRGQPVNALVGNIDNIGVFYAPVCNSG